MKWVMAVFLSLFVMGSATAQDWSQAPVPPTPQEFHSNPWLLSWIPATCCVTNDCCWEISSTEVRSLPDDEWEIKSTGQVRKRTGWSPDGKYYRCACDYDNTEKAWVKHQGANTRCIFVPMMTGFIAGRTNR